MEPTDAIKTCFSKFAVFYGRATLPEFWWWALFVAVTAGAAYLLTPALAGVVLLALALPSAAVAARRLHDTNRSGWWALLAVIPFPGLAFLAALSVFQGTPGPNRFGPDPLGREAVGPTPPMPGAGTKSVAVWQDRR